MENSAAPPPLQAITTRMGDKCIVKLAGEFDLAAVDLVRKEIAGAVRSDATSVVIDLSGLEFIDSSGLAVLMDADARSRADSNRVSFQGPLTPPVAKILRVTELDRLLELD
jgi:anti-sigma B factor antagonist